MDDRPDELSGRACKAALVLIAVVLAVVALRARPPAPNMELDADAGTFSAGRTLETIRILNPESEPHPVGSAAHSRVRERLLAQLRTLGLTPEVQQSWACESGAVCAPVSNVLVRIPGAREGPAVMVSAHYDSVHAGPGAGDDLHGVAIVVEIARALVAAGTHSNPVVLLVTDGEEEGLLGARAFVDEHRWAREVAVVVNVEARGTRGRSNMFETSPGNGPLLTLYADAVDHPSASSLSYEVYRRMPNDTDFTVFQRAGMAGMNFAFIGAVAHYHTPLDDLEQLSAASVQHQGESVLAVTRALADADLDALEGSDAAYADVLGLFMLRWPAPWSGPLTALLGVGGLAAGVGLRRRRGVSGRAMAWGVVAALGTLICGLAVAYGVDRLVIALAGHPTPWYAHPLPHRTALWAATGSIAVLSGTMLGRRAGAWGLAFGGSIVLVFLGAAAAGLVPGASPIFVLPLGAGVIGLLLAGWGPPRRWRDAVGLLLPLGITAIVWLPLSLAFEQAFGFAMATVVALPIAVVAMIWAPTWAGPSGRATRRWTTRVLILVAVAGIVAGALVEPYSPSRPRRLNVLHHTDVDRAEAFVALGPNDRPLPPSMHQLAAFEELPRAALPWTSALDWLAPAEPLDAPPPELEILERTPTSSGRRLRLHLRSRRNADRIMLLLPADVPLEQATVQGHPLSRDRLPARWHDHKGILVFGPPPEGIELEVTLDTPDPVPARLVDLSTELSPVAATLTEARGPTAVRSQWSDGTSMLVRHEL